MTRQQVTQTHQQSKSQAPLVSGILQRAAVRRVPDNEVQPTEQAESSTFKQSRFNYDFSQVPVRSMPLNDSSVTISAQDKYEQKVKPQGLRPTLSDGINLGESNETLTDDIEGGSTENTSNESQGNESTQHDASPLLSDVITLPSVAFGTIDYSKTTPLGMSERIPPRKSINVPITISGGSKGTKVDISIDGAGGSNGDGTINGKASVTKKSSGTLTLKGTQQTVPGNAGKLNLVAKVGGAEVGRSNSFTICAIPTEVKVKFGGLITGTERGIKMTTYNNSDSGKVTDLDQVQMSEMVQYQNGAGCFAGITSGSNSGYLRAKASPHGVDSHSTPISLISGVGYIESVQGFKFKDDRSGVTDIGVKNSGFMIERTVTVDKKSNKYITTHKYGTPTTVSGISVQTGQGSAKKKQKI
jgi:hypothetical protein